MFPDKAWRRIRHTKFYVDICNSFGAILENQEGADSAPPSWARVLGIAKWHYIRLQEYQSISWIRNEIAFYFFIPPTSYRIGVLFLSSVTCEAHFCCNHLFIGRPFYAQWFARPTFAEITFFVCIALIDICLHEYQPINWIYNVTAFMFADIIV